MERTVENFSRQELRKIFKRRFTVTLENCQSSKLSPWGITRLPKPASRCSRRQDLTHKPPKRRQSSLPAPHRRLSHASCQEWKRSIPNLTSESNRLHKLLRKRQPSAIVNLICWKLTKSRRRRWNWQEQSPEPHYSLWFNLNRHNLKEMIKN